MSAKLYRCPSTLHGRYMAIIAIHTGQALEGRDFDAEADDAKRKHYAKVAAEERAQKAAQAALEAAKIVPFRRYGGQR